MEVAFLHRASKSLLLTDIAVVVPRQPPAVCLADPTTLLYEARDTASEPVRTLREREREQREVAETERGKVWLKQPEANCE